MLVTVRQQLKPATTDEALDLPAHILPRGRWWRRQAGTSSVGQFSPAGRPDVCVWPGRARDQIDAANDDEERRFRRTTDGDDEQASSDLLAVNNRQPLDWDIQQGALMPARVRRTSLVWKDEWTAALGTNAWAVIYPFVRSCWRHINVSVSRRGRFIQHTHTHTQLGYNGVCLQISSTLQSMPTADFLLIDDIAGRCQSLHFLMLAADTYFLITHRLNITSISLYYINNYKLHYAFLQLNTGWTVALIIIIIIIIIRHFKAP